MNLQQHKIGLIGAGNMAYFLLEKLSTKLKIQVWNHVQHYSDNLKVIYKNTEIHHEFNNFIEACDVILLAINDNALDSMIDIIKPYNKIIIHHSGTYQISQNNIYINHGVLWPVYSIIKSQVAHYDRQIPLVYQGSTAAVEKLISEMADLISDQKFVMNAEQKQYAHLIAVMSNNFINHLIAQCQNVAIENGLDFKMFHPIIHQTINQLDTATPLHQLQSGPAKRKDSNTINTHEFLLKNHPDLQSIYTIITQSIIKQYSHE